MDLSSSITRFVYPTGVLVRLSGQLDESLDTNHLIQLTMGKGVVVFDLEQVTRMTSYAIREWMNALDQLTASYYCFIRCHPTIVSQFSMVDGFSGRGELVSLYAPYACETCDSELERLFDLRTEHIRIKTLDLPEMACSACGNVARFDDVADIYFDYVRSARPPSPPPEATAIIDGDDSSRAKAAFKLKKDISGDINAFWMTGALERTGYFRRAAHGLEGESVVIAAELAGINGAGLADLAQFLTEHERDACLARVPFALLAAFADALAGTPARVVSVQLPFHCTACAASVDKDIDLDALLTLSRGTALPCTACDGGLVPVFDAEELALASSLVAVAAPPQVAAYLAQARGPTVRAEASKRLAGVVLGRYQVVRHLGEGGMGEVLLAHQTGPGNFEKRVVLKRIRRDLAARDAQLLEDFLTEARVAARLTHPNIVQIFEVGELDGDYYIAMEYVQGIDLYEAICILRAERRLCSIACACRIASDVCAGLSAAHSYVDDGGIAIPVVHRDVSPSNVLLSVEGAVKLTDFGIAKAADTGTTTKPGVFKGKSSYAPPEQLLGGEVDPRSDVYAVGAMLFEMLSGQPFRRGRSSAGSLILADLKYTRSVRELRPEVPERLDAIVQRAVSFEPEHRFDSARSMHDALEQVLREVGYMTPVALGEWVGSLTASRTRHQRARRPAVTQTTQRRTRGSARDADDGSRSG